MREDYSHPELDWCDTSRLILITAHRRENLGEPMHHMFRAIRRVLDEHDDVKATYPIHLNPVVRQAAYDAMAHASNPYGDGYASVRIVNILQGLLPEHGIE